MDDKQYLRLQVLVSLPKRFPTGRGDVAAWEAIPSGGGGVGVQEKIPPPKRMAGSQQNSLLSPRAQSRSP